MTSSWALTQRKNMIDPNGEKTWSISKFGDPDNTLGGWEDHYIINGAIRECRPGFQAIPIGRSDGFHVCRRLKRADGRGTDAPPPSRPSSDFNGTWKYSADLYRPWMRRQIQMYDPYNYYDRTAPNEDYLHARDYLARQMKFNGTGVTPVHTPGPRKPHGSKNEKFAEYGYSFSPSPPYKYDVTRLHQAYPVWKKERQRQGDPIPSDRNVKSVTASTF